MTNRILTLSLAFLCLLYSCVKETVSQSESQEVELCMAFEDGTSKAYVDQDGVSVRWENSDKIGLWAKNSAGQFVFSNQEFKVFAREGGRTFFTTTLASAMTAGKYTYYACSPRPSSVDGLQVGIDIPASQDGKGSGIMMATPVKASELHTYDESPSILTMKMHQMLHLLQLYVLDTKSVLSGEKIKRIELSFPSGVSGRYVAQLDDIEERPVLYNPNSDIKVFATDDFDVSLPHSRKYLYASIFPKNWEESDVLKVVMYTADKMVKVADIPLSGRSMQAGHATPVAIVPESISPHCSVKFSLASNNIGETVSSISLQAPTGCKFGDNIGNTYTYTPGSAMSIGDSFTIEYNDVANFRTLSGKQITVTFETEHASVSNTITMPNLGSVYSTNVSLNAPYLLFEDFSSVSTFSQHDEHATSSTGSYQYSFMNGWSGGRIGAKAGKMIRIAGHRESGLFVDAHYPARVDSSPVAKLKKAANLKVEFDYGTNSGGIDAYGQTVYIGYINTLTNYSSGDTNGTYEYNFYTEEKTSDWTTPNNEYYVLHNVPASSTIRISFRNDPKNSQDFASNTTAWFYLDNLKVSISNE